MANLGAMNKIMRLQKLLLSLNYHNYMQQTAAASSNSNTLAILVRNQHRNELRACATQQQKSQLNPTAINKSPHRYYSSSGSGSGSGLLPPTTTTATETTSVSPASSIDEFRAREEQREQEFAQQQATEEAKSKQETEDDAKRAKVDAIRQRILAAALAHVPTHGWTRNAIAQGAEEAGFPSVVHGMFPEGGFALVSYFNGHANEELIKLLQQETNNGKREITDPVVFLVHAVRRRLEMIVPYKSQWPQALGLIALPQNASTSLAQVLTLVDDICYYSGDRSVDFGWYTRRIGLATIMKMTELYLLQDKSPDHAKTWEFLQNRMDEAVQMQMMLSQTEDVTQTVQRSFNSAFITARNILGLGYNR